MSRKKLHSKSEIRGERWHIFKYFMFTNPFHMLYKQLLSLLLILPPLLFGSCGKDDSRTNCPGSKLPNITSVGANTFGCRIDGEDWSPYVKLPTYPDPLFIPDLVVDYSEPYKFFNILVRRKINEQCGGDNHHISWGIRHDSDLNITSSSFSFLNLDEGVGDYKIDSNSTVSLNIHRFDTINRVFSGEFSFTLQLEDKTQTLSITDGRFDLQY